MINTVGILLVYRRQVMTERPTEFAYHNIELYKSESLGSGSYGGVCKAKCDGLLCAAKIIHPTLFDLRDPGTASYLRKFREECHLLSLARHPNVVQYLGTYTDPDTRLPVLLMELCDKSLTSFLERSPGPLSYHVQVNICHDIALALVYLHSNGLIHRDLTGNNVLMIAGTRAKITDFGMSKLATVNPRMTALTLCPGNVLYMSPEALDEAKSYTAKLDVFSFGVIVIQILTRQFPNPTDRFCSKKLENEEEREDEESDDSEDGKNEVRQVIPETERRAAQLHLIPDTHSLKPLALQCLKQKERRRPSALQLSERLSELKQSSQYAESMHQAESSDRVKQLELQLRGQRILTETQAREDVEHQEHISGFGGVIDDKDRGLPAKNEQIEEKDGKIQTKDEHLQAMSWQLQAKERELQQIQQALQHAVASRGEAEQLVSEFQQSLQQKHKAIADLQRTISEYERKIQQLEQQDIASGPDLPPKQSVATPQKTEPAAQKDISRMKWRKGKNAPVAMDRLHGAAVVYGNTAYFIDSHIVYSYKVIQGEKEWSQLPDNPYEYFGLAVIDGLLTSVGGYNNGYTTNTLLSLTGEGKRKQWSEIFPPMPTPRSHAACVSTEQTLIVAGGKVGNMFKDAVETVEVLNINTKLWTAVTSFPQKSPFLSATLIGDTLYIAGDKNSIFTCSIPDLLSSATTGSSPVPNVWKSISDLPVTGSTLVSFGGHLLAIGGEMGEDEPTSNVYRYDFNTNFWTVASQLKKKRYYCLAVALGDSVVVVGGYSPKLRQSETDTTYSVEILK